MAYHHPDVTKALAFHKYVKGRDAVAADLHATLEQFNLEFVENRVESLMIEDEIAVEQTVFTIKGTPKRGGGAFSVQGSCNGGVRALQEESNRLGLNSRDDPTR